jgi:hypothetical protein
MANLEQKRFASMVRMLREAYPRRWEQHLRNLGVTSLDVVPANLDEMMQTVFWMVPQAGIKNPAAWMAFDMERAEAASASVEPEASPQAAVRQNPVELKPFKFGTELAKTSGASSPSSETVIKEPAAWVACDVARVKAGSASVEPAAALKVALPQNRAEAQPVKHGVEPAKTANASPIALQPIMVIDRLLSQAKLAIEANDRPEAADAMFIAHEKYGATQQQIAAAVGRSQPWISCMLRWRREGFKDDTPFGPASKEARMAARFGRLLGRWPRGMVLRWMRRYERVAGRPKDDAHASVSSRVLRIGVKK